MSASSLPLAATPTAATRGRWARRNAWVLGVYLLLLLLLGVLKVTSPTFGSYELRNLVDGALPLALAAFAQGVIVISGGIDLSIGAMMSLVDVIAARSMLNTDLKTALFISALLVVGTALAGAITGALITLTRVPDIVVTLATSFVWAGLALQVMPTPGGGGPQEFQDLLTGELGGPDGVVPAAILVMVVVLVVVWIPLRRTRLGLGIYAIGSNRTAAYLSGIPVWRTRIAAYTVGGVFAALAGLTLMASTLSGDATSGTSGAGYTLNSVAAIVVGGISLTGGRGGLIGPLAAAIVLQGITQLLTVRGVDANVSIVIQGTLVIAVVMIAGLLLLRRRA
jgi:ribose transport system permease protein